MRVKPRTLPFLEFEIVKAKTKFARASGSSGQPGVGWYILFVRYNSPNNRLLHEHPNQSTLTRRLSIIKGNRVVLVL